MAYTHDDQVKITKLASTDDLKTSIRTSPGVTTGTITLMDAESLRNILGTNLIDIGQLSTTSYTIGVDNGYEAPVSTATELAQGNHAHMARQYGAPVRPFFNQCADTLEDLIATREELDASGLQHTDAFAYREEVKRLNKRFAKLVDKFRNTQYIY